MVPALEDIMPGTNVRQDSDKVHIEALNEITGDSLPEYIGGGVIASEEEEVNSEIKTLDAPEADHEAKTPLMVSKSVHPTKLATKAPVFSSMSGAPTESVDGLKFVKNTLLAGMSQYLVGEFRQALNGGFSNMRMWWSSKFRDIEDNLKTYFYIDPETLVNVTETFLEQVDAYLTKRHENIQALSEEERDKNLAYVESKIYTGQFKSKALAAELSKTKEYLKSIDTEIGILQQKRGELASKLDHICDQEEKTNEHLNSLEMEKTQFQNSRVRDIAAVEAIDQIRVDLEQELMMMVGKDWAQPNL